ncbi:MAG: thiamine pyrophosphate-binding protein [Chloroflexi bacterium]|nr:thiamine pyrophosphate-binding protein [Chloroflexota bacterium]
MTEISGARAFLHALKSEGVTHLFGNPGTSESAIMALLPEFPDIEYVLATQEGVAMGMADGYAQASGRPAVVNLHIETGLANGISLLHHAMDGGTPLVLTAGNKDVRKLAEGRTDLADMVGQFTRWSVEVTHPDQVPGALRRAFQEAKAAPTGPVFVGLAANALNGTTDAEVVPSGPAMLPPVPNPAALEQAAHLLAGARNPLMVVGDRLSQSGGMTAAVDLAETLGAGVYAASIARANFPSGHPQFLGRINPTLAAGRQLLAASDVILAVGANVFSGFFYTADRALGPGTRLIHLDSAQREIGKTEPADIPLFGDPRAGMEALTAPLKELMGSDRLDAASIRKDGYRDASLKARQARQRALEQVWDARPMAPERMMHEVAKALPADSLLIDDSLSSKDALHGAVKFDRPDSIIGERIGAIGWGMGAALGAKLALPHRPVLAVVGDGSAMMTVQALWTAASYNIPAVYLVCNNRSYRILKLNMNIHRREILGQEVGEDFEGYVGMDFNLPLNLAGMAEANGVYGRTISDPEAIGPEIAKALESGKPAVLDVVIDGRV